MDIVIPGDLWEDDSEGAVTAWLYDDGAQVQEGAVIVEVMTDKVQHELSAPTSGTLRIRAQLDDIVNKGDVIGTIEAPGG
ncbi:MAG: lipoyl domain-containing protein [Myxococcota bacterium]